MKTIRFFFIIFTVISCFSCSKNNLTVKVDLGEVALNLPISYKPSEEPDLSEENVFLAVDSTDNLHPFEGRLDKLSLKDTIIFSGFADFQTLQKQLFIKNVQIQIKKESTLKGSLINGIKATAYNNFNGNEISVYERNEEMDFATEYFSDSKLADFVKDIFAYLEKDKDNMVNIILSGMTDIESEDKDIQIGEINILLELSANIEMR